MSYFHVQTTHPCPLVVSAGWLSANRERVCSSCFSVVGDGALDIGIERVEDAPLNLCVQAAVGVIRLDLLSGLGEQRFRKELRVGRVFDASGREISDFFTFRAAEPVRIWGGPGSTDRRCPECSSDLFYPMGEWSLRPEEVGGRHFYERIFSQLIVADQALAELDDDERRELSVMRLPVRERQ